MKRYLVLFLILAFVFTLPFGCDDSGDDDDDSGNIFTGTFNLVNASAYENDQFGVAIFVTGADPETATPVESEVATISGGTAQIIGSVPGGVYDMYAMIDADGSGMEVPNSGDRFWEETGVTVDENGSMTIDAVADMYEY